MCIKDELIQKWLVKWKPHLLALNIGHFPRFQHFSEFGRVEDCLNKRSVPVTLFQLFDLSLWYIIPVIRTLMHGAEVSTSLDFLVSQQPGLNCITVLFLLIFLTVPHFSSGKLYGEILGSTLFWSKLGKKHSFTLPPCSSISMSRFFDVKTFKTVKYIY